MGQVAGRRRARPFHLGAVALALWLAPPPAGATPEWVDKLDFSGYALSDLRFDVDNYRGPTPGQGYTFSTNRNDVDFKLRITPHPGVVAVVEPRLRYYGFVSSQTLAVADLWDASKVSPFTMYLDQAYVAVKGVPKSWIDLKAGRMQVTWGSADVFSPNDNLSARDLSDPLDYTRKVPNEMLEVDAYPSETFSINAVWAPIFQPSWLPPSAPLAYAVEKNAAGCLTSFPAPPLTVSQNQQLEGLFSAANPCALNFPNPSVTTYLPDNKLTDSQFGIRARISRNGLDVGFNYFYGRFTFPIAYDASVAVTPGSPTPSQTTVNYSAEVIYPRMHVAGADFNYSAPWLFDIGFVGDFAVFFPEPVRFALGIYENGSPLLTLSHPNVTGQPFVKGTLGAERSFGDWLYIDALFIHGFFDEFSDAYGLHDYVSVTPEVRTLRDRLKLRLATILDLTDRSGVVYPQLTWTVLPSVELMVGAFILEGNVQPKNPLDYASRSKFGQPAAGRDELVERVTVTW